MVQDKQWVAFAACRPLVVLLGLVPLFVEVERVFAGLMDTQQACLLRCIDIISFDFAMFFTVGCTVDTYDFISSGREHDPIFVVAVAIHEFTCLCTSAMDASEYGAHCRVETHSALRETQAVRQYVFLLPTTKQVTVSTLVQECGYCIMSTKQTLPACIIYQVCIHSVC